MRNFSTICFTSLVLVLFGLDISAQTEAELKKRFQDPPVSAFPKTYWWWLNGHIDTVRIREEMLAMHAAGLSGFDIFDIGVPANDTVVKPGAPFLGEESLAAIQVALKLAKKLGMTAGLSMASSWNAGGAWTMPEHAAKSIYYSETNWTGEKNVLLKFPEIEKMDKNGKPKWIEFEADGKPVYYEDVVVLAIPEQEECLEPASVIDVTKYFDPVTEEFHWNGRGSFKILRYICSNSGEQLKLPSKRSAGPIIDHFDAKATESHFNYVLDKLKTILPEGIENSALKSLYLASYEATGFTWTSTLPEEFKRINGYDIYPFIPALFDQNIFAPEVTEMFKRDFRRTLSELMINNFYRVAKEISNANGLKINSESGGPGYPLHNVPVEPLKSLGVMDLPRGEFWINHTRLNADGIDILRVVKEVSSASHIYGREVVEEEAFTTFQHWQEGPFEMKPAGDRAFCEGMNKVVVHGSSHNPRGYGLPGIYYGASTHFNDRRIWWPKVRPFTEYLARISYIAQECDFVSDVLYYYGDAIPNYAGHKNGRFMIGPGYDYEVINTEILKQLSVKGGMLELPTGARFRLLVLEPENEMHPEVFQKLQGLLDAGATVVGEKPKAIQVRKNLPELNYTGKDIEKWWKTFDPKSDQPLPPKVLTGVKPVEILQQLNLEPDFSYPDDGSFTLDYIHYQKNDWDFYFIRNTTDQWITRTASFRQTRKRAELWNPINGDIEPALLGEPSEGRYDLPLSLPPFGSLMVVFKPQGSEDLNLSSVMFGSDYFNPPDYTIENDKLFVWNEGFVDLLVDGVNKTFSNYIKEQPLEGAWELFFPSGWSAPERVIFPELISWTDSEIEGVEYFSGIATYKKTFQYEINSGVQEKKEIFLDLGDLTNVAEVRLNNIPLGITWAKPYRFKVTKVIKAGDNVLEVEIANTWNNRLKGDAVTGSKFTNTNISNTNVAGLNKIRLPWSEVPLIRSGLFGPVKLLTLQPIDLR